MGAIYPVLAVYKKDPTHENWNSYTTDGKLYTEGDDSQADLFFAPEKKEGWINLYRDEDGKVRTCTAYPIESEKDAKMLSKYIKDYVETCKIEWEK